MVDAWYFVLAALIMLIIILRLILHCCKPQFTSPVASRGPHQSVDASINITPAMHQSNLRNGIPSPLEESHEFVSRLPRNYSMVDIPSQVHTFHGPYRSNSSGATMTPPPTPTSHMMPSMPCEPPRYPSISAFTLASSNETVKGGECTVCLTNLKGQDAVVQMPLCSHLFHEKCIRKWLLRQPSCPLCRSPFYA